MLSLTRTLCYVKAVGDIGVALYSATKSNISAHTHDIMVVSQRVRMNSNGSYEVVISMTNH